MVPEKVTKESFRAELERLVAIFTATDKQIDALVYDLYALTPDEIALIEKALPDEQRNTE